MIWFVIYDKVTNQFLSKLKPMHWDGYYVFNDQRELIDNVHLFEDKKSAFKALKEIEEEFKKHGEEIDFEIVKAQEAGIYKIKERNIKK